MTGLDIYRKIVTRSSHVKNGYKVAIFVINGKIGIWPHNGQRTEKMFEEHSDCLMGVYDKEVSPCDLDEDLEYMKQEGSNYFPDGD